MTSRSGWIPTAPTRGRCRTYLALGVAVGAPPDEYNQLGQDWSQPPWRPDRLVEMGYAPFRAQVNAVLRHAGGVRIDHIIGLFRLWWIPKGAKPTEGTYVRYDHEAMIGIVALEAHRAGAVVVGEDLGTVEPWVRDYLRERGLLGTSILWFEQDEWRSGAPKQAQWWREYCLSSVTTHDLPPTAGYLAGEHVRIRQELGLLDPPGRGGTRGRPRRAGGVAGRTAPRRAVGLRTRADGRRGGAGALRIRGGNPVAVARPCAARCGGRRPCPESARHHRRVPELAGAAGRSRRPSTRCWKTCSATRVPPRSPRSCDGR